MADIDILPARGVPAMALVDSTGVASNGSQTVAQLAAKGVRSVCAVDATGVSVGGATVAQLASAGIRAFCPVDELGVSQAGPTADALRRAGIRPMVLLNNTGIALTGSATMLTLAQRGLQYFCPVDEAGNATTMGAVVLLSNSTVLDSIAIGANVGVLSVAGGSGTYTYSLTSNPGGKFAIVGANLNTAAALTAGTYPITVQASGGVPTPINRNLNITVVAAGGGGTAPILTITSGSSVLTPTFSVVYFDTVGVDDIETLQQDTNTAFPTPVTYTHTITTADVTAGSFGFGNGPLVNGTYYFRTKSTSHGIDTPWSNIATITILDTAATITSPNTDSVASGQVLAHALTASKTVTWSISGGVDAAQFGISGSTLTWVGNGAQNAGAPADSNADNVYVVQVTATTAGGTTTNQTISVTVGSAAFSMLRSDGTHILRSDGSRVLRS